MSDYALPKIKVTSGEWDQAYQDDPGTPKHRRSAQSNSQMVPLARSTIHLSSNRRLKNSFLQTGSQGLDQSLTAAGVQFLNFIRGEVSKFCASKRLNEASIKELDQKIQMECYLREKKEAILQDRKMDII